mmetsp:Transcript_58609/g.104566  ORF Transcript_58609/g.104566 Transcript_58609/m.104566 type:complete len:287 (-) Transcript_58609:742-1602(-)
MKPCRSTCGHSDMTSSRTWVLAWPSSTRSCTVDRPTGLSSLMLRSMTDSDGSSACSRGAFFLKDEGCELSATAVCNSWATSAGIGFPSTCRSRRKLFWWRAFVRAVAPSASMWLLLSSSSSKVWLRRSRLARYWAPTQVIFWLLRSTWVTKVFVLRAFSRTRQDTSLMCTLCRGVGSLYFKIRRWGLLACSWGRASLRGGGCAFSMRATTTRSVWSWPTLFMSSSIWVRVLLVVRTLAKAPAPSSEMLLFPRSSHLSPEFPLRAFAMARAPSDVMWLLRRRSSWSV